MAVVLRIVCVFSVLCAAALEAAPTVTYDQRQQGEFNLQVDLDDVAIVLLPGGEFRQKNALAGQVVHQIFGRRNGAAGSSKKKHKPAAVNCTPVTTPATVVTTAKPAEVPDNEYDKTPVYPADRPNKEKVPAPVSEINEPVDTDGKKILSYYDPYSVTPNTPDIFKKNVFEVNIAVEGSAETVQAEKPVENPAIGSADETVTKLTEMVVVKTVDRPAAAATDLTTTSAAADISERIPMDGNKSAATDETNFDENPVSMLVNVKTVEKTSHAHETVKTGEMSATEDNKSSNERTVVPIADKPAVQKAENVAKFSTTDDAKPEDNNKPIEMVVMKTIEKSTSSETLKFDKKPADAVTDKTAAVPEVAIVPATTSIDSSKKPTEIVAMKTMEKPTFAEALKAAKTPADAVAVPETDVSAATTSHEFIKTSKENVALKMAEKPSNVWSANSIEKSEGITTSTKLVEIQEMKKTPSEPTIDEKVLSRAAPKLTEMVAVKTMEIPATVTTMKNVTSVKTVIKSGTPKTTLSSNGSSILRKVGDRKPLPSITMEIATPKVV